MNRNGTSQTPGVVTVGVDGSPAAGAALRWAVAEARLRETRLRVVHAWKFHYPVIEGFGYVGSYVGGSVDVLPDAGMSLQRQAAEDVVEQAIAELGTKADGVKIKREVVEGPAADVLVGAVTEDDLLVVGSRGRGGFAGLLLGSVSQHCAHRASCPVVIVRTGEPTGDESRSARPASTESGAAA
jgi:nucleotide-binding universal stress UspA family protein